jgi:energy-coupling factor transporter ATP-binding protein EcfA2
MSATSLAEAVAVFDPREPLYGETFDAYYVSRDLSPVGRLANLLHETSGSFTKVVFVGHRGSGKSTELARLTQALEPHFFVADYTVEGNLDLTAVDYIQVLFALVKSMYESARSRNVELSGSFITRFRDWFQTAMADVVETTSSLAPPDVQLDAFFFRIGGKLGSEVSTRVALKQKLEPRVSELIDIIDDLADEIRTVTQLPVLAVLDGLDKPDLAVAKQLFVHHATALAAPRCQIVYTVPLSLLFSSDYSVVRQSFSQFVLPNITTLDLDGRPYRRGATMLRDLVLRRLDRRLVSRAALDGLIQASGGVLRELVQLTQGAATYALTMGASQITVEAVRLASQEVTQNFRRVLRPNHYEELLRVRAAGPGAVFNEVVVQLIENGSLLEYDLSGKSWFGVHPLVEPILDGLGMLEG